jgi:hypothetical protein
MAIIAGALAAGAMLMLLGAVVLLLVSNRPPPRTAPWYDYSALLQVLSDPALRYPTEKELKAFPVLWPTVPVEENAAFYYAKAARLVKETGEPAGHSSLEPYTGDLAALEAWVAANKPAMNMAIEGNSHRVCRTPIFITTMNGCPNSAPSGFLSLLRHLGICFGDAGLAEEMNDRPRAAANCYLACIRMAAQLRKGLLVQSEVGSTILPMGVIRLDRLVANVALPEDDLRRIIQACAEAETSPAEIADNLDCETEYYAAYLRNGTVHEKLAKVAADVVNGDSRSLAVARKDAKLPIYEVINNPAAQHAFQNFTVGEGNEPPEVFWGWRKVLGRLDTELRALQIRAAIALYQRQHGKLPDTLDALCPQFMPKVPLDPFSGKPLRYRISKEGWVVWSVGPDLTYDGGVDKQALRMAKFRGSWQGKDSKGYIFVSGVTSITEQIQRGTVLTVNPGMEDQDIAALVAERISHPDMDSLGLTPLHRAANRGDFAAVEALLAKGADVNARGLAKQTPLHLAVTKEIVQLLISKGAQIEARDRRGRTPLFWAAGAGRRDVVEALLAAGVQADALEVVPPAIADLQSPRTPITFAAEQGHDDIAELLRKYMAEHPAKQQNLPAR